MESWGPAPRIFSSHNTDISAALPNFVSYTHAETHTCSSGAVSRVNTHFMDTVRTISYLGFQEMGGGRKEEYPSDLAS